MMSRRVNKQPGIQRFWNLCCYYQNIYDWISQFNKPSGSWFILTLQSMGKWVCFSSNLHIFTFLKHLIMLWSVIFFQGFINFYTASQTLVACRAMQLSGNIVKQYLLTFQSSSFSEVHDWILATLDGIPLWRRGFTIIQIQYYYIWPCGGLWSTPLRGL